METIEDLEELEKLFKSEKKKAFLFWSLNKGIQTAISTRDISLLHFFLVKVGVKLDNSVHDKIIISFLDSIKEADFIYSDNENQEILIEMFKMLITFRANVNCRDVEGRTPLHLAVDRKQLPLSLILLNNGADLYARDNEQNTAFSICRSNKDDLVFSETARILKLYASKNN